jgi:acetyl/propionyl-CoA carboxylase alpha subunit
VAKLMPRLDVSLDRVSLTVDLARDGRATIGGETYVGTMIEPGLWRLEGADSSFRAWVAGPPDAPWVYFGGRVYRLEVGPAGRARTPRVDVHGALAAPMPATVRAVLVSVGDRVARGDVLIILEAMKMELPLRAGADGLVTVVRCTPGELVQPGAPLVEVA